MKMRDYQDAAVKRVLAQAVAGIASTLLVIPTGGGKTVIFSEIANQLKGAGRVMVIAHRTELIDQAADKLGSITGIMPAIEKAEQRSDEWNVYGKPPIVVGSVQTLSSGNGKRLSRFDPHEFALLVIDEAHHATSDSYRRVITHFRQNAQCLVLGVTATPDRGDGENLGQVFESCAFEYTLHDAVDNGYLVPIRQRTVEIAGLDFAKVRTTAGDLNAGDLEAVMMLEKPLHGIAHATLEVVTGIPTGSLSDLKEDLYRAERFRDMRSDRMPLRTLVFATSVAHSERLAEIFNRWIPDCSDFIDGSMTAELRKEKLKRFAANDFQILVNCMIATEGFDAPFVECVTVARPTKSRPLFAQIVGRGTRPSISIASLLGLEETPIARRAMIAASDKPHCLILDFAGNNGRHELVTMVDLIAPSETPEDVLILAKELATKEEIGTEEAISKAKEEIERKKRQAEERRRKAEIRKEEERKRAAEDRKALVGIADYDIYDHGSIGLETRKKANTNLNRQIAVLQKAKIPDETIAKMPDSQIKDLSRECIRRFKAKLCTYKQALFLRKHGYTKQLLHDMGMNEASTHIQAIIDRKGVLA